MVLHPVPDALDTIRVLGRRIGIVGFVVAQQSSSMMSVTVPDRDVARVALALTTPSFPGARRVAMPLVEFERRAHWIGRGAALVTSAELAQFRGRTLERSLPHVMSLRKRGFLVSEGCVLINGWQMGRSTGDIDADEVEAVKVYMPGSDYTGTLASRGCLASDAIGRLSARPFSGARRSAGGSATIVVWLKS